MWNNKIIFICKFCTIFADSRLSAFHSTSLYFYTWLVSHRIFRFCVERKEKIWKWNKRIFLLYLYFLFSIFYAWNWIFWYYLFVNEHMRYFFCDIFENFFRIYIFFLGKVFWNGKNWQLWRDFLQTIGI